MCATITTTTNNLRKRKTCCHIIPHSEKHIPTLFLKYNFKETYAQDWQLKGVLQINCSELFHQIRMALPARENFFDKILELGLQL